jgi:hypothetical protein
MFLKIGTDHVVNPLGFSIHLGYQRGVEYSQGWRKARIDAEMLMQPTRLLLYTKTLTHWRLGFIPKVRLWKVTESAKRRIVRRACSALDFLGYKYELDDDNK